jgi:hypothetical protein
MGISKSWFSTLEVNFTDFPRMISVPSTWAIEMVLKIATRKMIAINKIAFDCFTARFLPGLFEAFEEMN